MARITRMRSPGIVFDDSGKYPRISALSAVKNSSTALGTRCLSKREAVADRDHPINNRRLCH